MKYTFVILISLIFLNACNNSTQEKPLAAEPQDTQKRAEGQQEDYKKQQQIDCEKYWKSRYPNDSLKASYLNSILAKSKLSGNNLRFLNALRNEKEDELAFEKVLSPIFRLSNTQIGIFAFPKYKQIGGTYIEVSREKELIDKFSIAKENEGDQTDKVRFYPMLLNAIFKGKPKPKINYYTTNHMASTQVLNLGTYEGECLEYYEYAIDTTNISLDDKLLFSSPFVIDLEFRNYAKVDSLLQKDYKEECLDCPNSSKLQKTFAKVKGTDNLYFVYADTFPLNNKLETPSRALVLINERNEVIYLWYEEIDLFGCSCL